MDVVFFRFWALHMLYVFGGIEKKKKCERSIYHKEIRLSAFDIRFLKKDSCYVVLSELFEKDVAQCNQSTFTKRVR